MNDALQALVFIGSAHLLVVALRIRKQLKAETDGAVLEMFANAVAISAALFGLVWFAQQWFKH